MDNNLVEEETSKTNGLVHDPSDAEENCSDHTTAKTNVEILNVSADATKISTKNTEDEVMKKVNGNSEDVDEVIVTNQNQSTDEDCFIVSSDDDEAEDDIETDYDDGEDNDVMITGISDTTGELQWRNLSDPMRLFYSLMMKYGDPEHILLNVFHVSPSRLPSNPDTQKALLFHILSEPQPRQKLLKYNTLDDVLNLLHTCTKILVITGAGISVSCGIPDFRSRNGIYARLAVDYPDLTTPQSMFELNYFKSNQEPFFKFAKEIYPGQYKPSISHRFIRCLETRDKLLRNYTQNIDTLEQVAGISRVINCHGSFATASCMSCKHQVPGSDIREDIFAQKIPLCPICPADAELAVMKPDIVFFGEELPDMFHSTFAEDKENADFVIVIGSSLKVRPVAYMPASVPANVPQILINREPLTSHEFDVELLGDCDIIIAELCQRLSWSDIFEEDSTTGSSSDNKKEPTPNKSISCEDKEHSKENHSSTSDHIEPSESDAPKSKIVENDASTGEEKKMNGTDTTIEQTDKPSSSSSRTKILNHLLTSSNCTSDMEPCTSSSVNKIIFNPGKLTEIDGELLLMDDEPSPAEQGASGDVKIQPKNLSEKLPAGSFACFKPSTYIFSGAEYFHLPEESDVNSVETVSSDSDDLQDGSLIQGHRASHPLCVSDDEDSRIIVRGNTYLNEDMECIIDGDDDENVAGSVCWKQRSSTAKRPVNDRSEVEIQINEDSLPNKRVKINEQPSADINSASVSIPPDKNKSEETTGPGGVVHSDDVPQSQLTTASNDIDECVKSDNKKSLCDDAHPVSSVSESGCAET